jgi:hypothetical protein
MASYVYCVVAASRAPSLARTPKGPAGLRRTRLVPVDARPGTARLWMVVADASTDSFSEDEINRHISDVDWVSRIAVAHEAVVASFIRADAVLPMKLFTIFANDERAAAHLASERAQIDRVLARVAKRDEWGVRLVLVAATGRRRAAAKSRPSGTSYLARKKAQRDARAELVERSREVAADLYDRLAVLGSDARRRSASEMPVKGSPLLLDAAFLVPRTRAARFRSTVAKHARALRRHGYQLSLTGPWPPYTFMRES